MIGHYLPNTNERVILLSKILQVQLNTAIILVAAVLQLHFGLQ
jgi:hypothetical protein